MSNLSLKIISGGQNGADRAALECACGLGIPTGGTAAKGWTVQDFEGNDYSDPTLAEFGLTECEEAGYPPHTKANVRDSDGTVWFGYPGSPGGKLTVSTCRKLGKPCIENPTVAEFVNWMDTNDIQVLNVAGNRDSAFNPDIYNAVYGFLQNALPKVLEIQDCKGSLAEIEMFGNTPDYL